MTSDVGLTPSGAVLSPCGQYRYALWRVWDATKPLLGFGLLNPSKADAAINDPTISRCCERARLLGFGGIVVWNLFAFRATDPKDMKRASDPVGPENDAWIQHCLWRCAQTICGWGRDGLYRARATQVLTMLPPDIFPLHYLRLSEESGQPWHPLYLSYKLTPQLWERWRNGANANQ